MAKHEWVNGASRRYVLRAEDIPELEREAGVYEFVNKKPREQAESEAYDSYRRKHHLEAAAHHLGMMRATSASGSYKDAKKHKLVYDLHLQQLGYEPNDHRVPDEIANMMNENKQRGLGFKAHAGDAFLLNKSEPLSLPVNEWEHWEQDIPAYNLLGNLNKSEFPQFVLSKASDSPLAVNFMTNKLRQMRDFFDQEKISSLNERSIDEGLRQKLMGLRIPRDYQGNFNRDAIQRMIDEAPTINFDWSTGTFDRAVGATQRHSDELSNVLRLDITPQTAQKLKDAGVWDSFVNMQNLSRESGHPITPLTAGWARWTGDKKGVHIDEIQSDFGRPWPGMLSEAARRDLGIPEERIPAYIAQLSQQWGLEEDKRKIIAKILFGNKHPGEVLHEGFHAWARGPGGLEGAPVHIWQPESKLWIANLDKEKRGHFDFSRPIPGHIHATYRDVPVKRGMEPGKYGQIPTQKTPQLKRAPSKKQVGNIGGDILWTPSNKTYKDVIRGDQETPQQSKRKQKSEEPVTLAELKKRVAETLLRALEKADLDKGMLGAMSNAGVAGSQKGGANAQIPPPGTMTPNPALKAEKKPYTGRNEGIRRSKLPPGAPGSDKAGVGVTVDKKKQANKDAARKWKPED